MIECNVGSLTTTNTSNVKRKRIFIALFLFSILFKNIFIATSLRVSNGYIKNNGQHAILFIVEELHAILNIF